MLPDFNDSPKQAFWRGFWRGLGAPAALFVRYDYPDIEAGIELDPSFEEGRPDDISQYFNKAGEYIAFSIDRHAK